MGKQINQNDFMRIRIMLLSGAIAMLVFSIIAFFSGFIVDLKNIDNFKNAYEVEAIPISTTLPHSFSSESYPCVVYEFFDNDGTKQTARFYNQIPKADAEILISDAEPIVLKYCTYLYPVDYNATLGVGSYFTIISFVIAIVFLLLFLFAFKGRQQDPSRVVRLGRKKIEVIIDGNLVQVFNAPTRLSLLVNGETVEFFDGMIAPRFALTTEIQTEEGVKVISLTMGHLYLRLYCDNVLVVKKFAGFG